MLVTADPTGRRYADVDWLVKSFAVTNLPSIYSLKAIRRQIPPSNTTKPMIAFADPIFSQKQREPAQVQTVATRGMLDFYQGARLDLTALGEGLPPLPGTRREVKAVGTALGADPSDEFLGDAATVTVVHRLSELPVVSIPSRASSLASTSSALRKAGFLIE